MATVDFGGVCRDACLEYAPEAGVGDHVTIPVVFAVTQVNEAEAQRTLAVPDTMGGVEDEPGEPLP
ncbi:HypC/HybG/HupF family hydrogenase formation chaperone [Streptomyces sp. NPDC058877]|uniref:HypC/HybG/HupF family hydrogenase formation chaperone n=1 Tax=unclassified Streptomyces TaxID=2593676 RepID=UPI003693D292